MRRGYKTWEEYIEKERSHHDSPDTKGFLYNVLAQAKGMLDKTWPTVLEIGCGDSGGFRYLIPCDKYWSVDAINGDSESPWGDLCIRAESLPMESDTFDLVMVSNALDHCEFPQEVADEIVRVLNLGGVLFTGHYIGQDSPHPWSFESPSDVTDLFKSLDADPYQEYDIMGVHGRDSYVMSVFRKAGG